MRVLIDTNILGRLSQPGHAMHATAVRAVKILRDGQHELRMVPQIIYEFCLRSTPSISRDSAPYRFLIPKWLSPKLQVSSVLYPRCQSRRTSMPHKGFFTQGISILLEKEATRRVPLQAAHGVCRIHWSQPEKRGRESYLGRNVTKRLPTPFPLFLSCPTMAAGSWSTSRQSSCNENAPGPVALGWGRLSGHSIAHLGLGGGAAVRLSTCRSHGRQWTASPATERGASRETLPTKSRDT